MDAIDQRLLREAFRLARQARDHGNQPFGALLAGPDRAVVLEAGNTVVTAGDGTGHAPFNLLRAASREFDRPFLRRCTLYASAEPCAMCSGAVFWAGLSRVVFGLSTARLHDLIGRDPTVSRLGIPCRGVLASGQPLIEVVGPVFQAEAEQAHDGYWAKAGSRPPHRARAAAEPRTA